MASSMATNIMQMDYMNRINNKRLQNTNNQYDEIIINIAEKYVEKSKDKWNDNKEEDKKSL